MHAAHGMKLCAYRMHAHLLSRSRYGSRLVLPGAHHTSTAMAALHGLQAESEIFRRGTCEQDDEEADFEEYQRRMRAAAKAKAPPPRSRPKPQTPPVEPPAPTSTREVLESEHALRVEQRTRLQEREERVDAVFSATLGGNAAVATSDPMSLQQMREELRGNERSMQADAVEFVGAHGK